MNQPDTDIASDGSLAGQLTAAFRNFMLNTDDMLPAQIVSYDDATNRATVKPLVMMVSTEGQKISRAPVANIPVYRFGGGGFFIRVPVKAGDFGWLKASDRDISLVFQRGGMEDEPNTRRMKSFSDAMFFPDAMKGWMIDRANIDALVIQSLDGSVCLSLHEGRVVLDAPLFEINATDTVITGSVAVNGSLTNNGVRVGSDHQHSGVQPGSGTTGAPV